MQLLVTLPPVLLLSYSLNKTTKLHGSLPMHHPPQNTKQAECHLKVELVFSTDLEGSFQDDGNLLQAADGGVQLVGEIWAQHASDGHSAHMPAVGTCQDTAHLSQADDCLLAGFHQQGLHLLLYTPTLPAQSLLYMPTLTAQVSVGASTDAAQQCRG